MLTILAFETIDTLPSTTGGQSGSLQKRCWRSDILLQGDFARNGKRTPPLINSNREL